MYDKDEFIWKITNCLDEFTSSELDLLIDNTREEAIAAALIPYLKKHFAEWSYNIDLNYDKMIINNRKVKKEVDFLLTSLPKSKVPKRFDLKHGYITKQVLPDLIFHDRNSNSHNFLVLEIKKSRNKNETEKNFDLIKLEIMTSTRLNYLYGAFVEFMTGPDYEEKEANYKLVLFNA